MRLSNDRDQALIRSAVSDAGASLLTFIPSLGTGEVFAFGAGVPLPTRMKFRELPPETRPTSEAGGNTRVAASAAPGKDMIGSVIDRWRAATMSHKTAFEEEGSDLGSWREDIAAPPLQPAHPAPAPEPPPQRSSILRRAIGAEPPSVTPPPPPPSRWR